MNTNDIAINAEGLSKCYRIGLKEQRSDSISGSIIDFIKSPMKNYLKYRSLYKFDDMRPDNGDNSKNPDIIWALKNISFKVKKGEVVGIIGRNGAGKSTLLKVLCKITDPTHGYATIHGRVSSLLEVGTGFHPELTGRENVYLNGTILGMTKKEIEQKFDDIVDFAGVHKFLETPVKRYSSGMRVRLGFAVAAFLEPEILIIDEVLAVGDAAFQKKCLDKMQDIGEHGRTVLFVSHNISAVTRLCTRTVYLEGGNVVDDGPSAKVARNYLTSGLGTMACREWKDPMRAPQGDVARLYSLKICDKNREISESIDISQPVALEMKYHVLKSGSRLMPFYHVYNEEGVEVFGIHDIDPKWMNEKRPSGYYTSTAWIPGNFLSEGTYFISAGLTTLNPKYRQFYERSAVGFQVTESREGGLSRGNWAGPMSGIIRPSLEWQTKYQTQG
ncbi:MAG: ABC transporter ATP-binding protein [Deltaproteobacteria bacterium]|nr:ABC transporter ATP-binding protein [Deltaproteobacteria bacterium]